MILSVLTCMCLVSTRLKAHLNTLFSQRSHRGSGGMVAPKAVIRARPDAICAVYNR